MRRWTGIFSLFFIILLVTGCGNVTSTTPSTSKSIATTEQSMLTTATSTTTTTFSSQTTTTEEPFDMIETDFITYASGVEFQAYTYNPIYRLPNVYIDITFTKITYTPVNKQVCLSFDVQDPDRANATYFAILQDRTYNLTRVLQQFYGNGTANFQAGACFTLADPAMPYRIVIGKIDIDNLNPTYEYVEGSAWVEWTDEYITERKTISIKSRVDTSPSVSDEMLESMISYSFAMTDAHNLIDDLVVRIYDTFGHLVNTQTYTASSIRSNGELRLSNSFADVAPNADYTIELSITGSDGIDSFTDQFLTYFSVHSSRFSKQANFYNTLSFDGLYGVMYEITYSSTEAIISYVYDNDYRLKYGGSDEYLELQLEVWDKNGNLMNTIPLELGTHEITIPLNQLNPGDYFLINDQRKANLFDKYVIPTLRPEGYFQRIDLQTYRFVLVNDYRNIIDIDIYVYVDGFAVMVESIDMPDIYQDSTFVIYHHIDDTMSVSFVFHVTYIAYGQEYTADISGN